MEREVQVKRGTKEKSHKEETEINGWLTIFKDQIVFRNQIGQF